jgi:hypothetical protein
METLDMVYLQYWCVEDSRTNYEKHIQVIMAHYCHLKSTHQKKTKLKKKGRKGQTSTAIIEDQDVTNTKANGVAALAVQVRTELVL